jgi:hypothetical protein
VTGLPCPTCGLTRSWIALLHARLGESVSLHPLGPVTVVAALLLVVGAHKRFPDLAARLRSRAVLGAAAVAWLAIWIVRLQLARP